MNYSLTEKRNENNEIIELEFKVYDKSCINSPVDYSYYRFTFKEHYAKDGKRILCKREN